MKNKDIAEILNISEASVSFALNNKQGVSEATRQKVMKLKYGDGQRKSITIVIFTKSGEVMLERPFFIPLTTVMHRHATDMGYDLNISHVDSSTNTEDHIELLSRGTTSGIILIATEMEPSDVKPYLKLDKPVVIVDGWFPLEKFTSILIDNIGGITNAVNHLVENGHREIGFLNGFVYAHNFDERYQAYNWALCNHGIKPNTDYSLVVHSTSGGAYHDICTYLQKRPHLPTAFLVANDIVAIGAINAFKENGYSVPHDISFVGFDDIPMCSSMNPQLSSIKISPDSIGDSAITLLINMIENTHSPTPPLIVRTGTELIVRNSVRNLTKSEHDAL